MILLLAALLQGPAPSITTSLDTGVVTVGDRLHLRLAVTHSASERVRWPDSLQLGPFEILDRRVSRPARSGDLVTDTLSLTLTAFELGELQLPAITATVEGGAAPVTLASDGWSVTVQSVGADSTSDIRDVKGPLSMPRNWLIIATWIAAALAVAALAWWMYRRYGRRVPTFTMPVAPPKPAHQLAYEELTALEREAFVDRGRVKEHYDGASDILRRYFERRYHVAALEMATGEVLDGLSRTVMEIGPRQETTRFLETCDLVKFAKMTPLLEASRALTGVARRIVDQTREPDPPAEAPRSAA